MKNKQMAYQMHLFAVLIRAGSFTIAAEQLNMTRSWLSQQISALETALNVQLLHRTTRSLRPTEAGEKFLLRCCELNELIDMTIDELNHSQTDMQGQIRLAAPHALMEAVVIPVIKILLVQHPELSIELLVDDSRKDLLSQQIDLALRAGLQPDSGLKARLIGNFREYWYAADSVTAAAEAIILPWQQQDGKLRVNNVHSATQMAIAGLGKVWLPDIYAQPYCNRRQLIQMSSTTEEINSTIPVYGLHAYTGRTPIRIKLLIEKLIEQFSNTQQLK